MPRRRSSCRKRNLAELQYVPAHEHRALFRFLESRDLRHGAAACGHSGLSPVNFTTLPHFSVSSAMSRPNAEGEPASGSPPISANFAVIMGSLSAALISRLSLSMTSTGVFFGAAMPYHWLASSPAPKTPTFSHAQKHQTLVRSRNAQVRGL